MSQNGGKNIRIGACMKMPRQPYNTCPSNRKESSQANSKENAATARARGEDFDSMEEKGLGILHTSCGEYREYGRIVSGRKENGYIYRKNRHLARKYELDCS